MGVVLTEVSFAGGGGAPYVDVIDYVTIGTTGNATDFGNLLSASSYVSMSGSDTRGIMAEKDLCFIYQRNSIYHNSINW